MTHLYKLAGNNIVLDTASGAIHAVDDVAWDAIKIYEKVGKEQIQKLLLEKYQELDEKDIIELVSEIEELVNEGKLYTEDTYQAVISSDSQTSLKALCLNVSHMCNMRCTYCFAGKGEYGSQGELMSLETGIRAIDFLIENSGEHHTLDVDFFGGEPLLNWNVVKGIVEYARKAEQGSGREFRFTLTTNALLIDEDVIEFSNKEMYNVVMSLDGRKDINDAMRILPGGKSSYDEILPKIKKLSEAREGREYYIRGTYTRNNLDFFNDIIHMADLGFSMLSLEPVVAMNGQEHSLRSDDLPIIFEQYEQLALEMLKRNKENRGFHFYHYELDLTGGPCIYKRLSGCGVGTEYLAVTPKGELYPCHQLVGEAGFFMGDIWQGVTNSKLKDDFYNSNIYTREKCKTCWARLYCSGGCAANAWHDTGDINDVYELGCELFKKRLECAIMMVVAQNLEKNSNGQ
ncbi:MAG: thioether cross-link-forming SCIFF peptide maturase [Oscillospiraceae bacterium]|nr:thioether cross-link-forming SCIFF peptide maturase [Oscillospiraceae bacterium]